MAQQALSKTYSSITHTRTHTHTHTHTYIYIYIYIHQSRSYQHLSTLKHPLLIILLGNSNNKSWVTYISSYIHLIQISTAQSKEQYVMNHFSSFHLNRTVNEPENTVLRKLRRLEKHSRPTIRSFLKCDVLFFFFVCSLKKNVIYYIFLHCGSSFYYFFSSRCVWIKICDWVYVKLPTKKINTSKSYIQIWWSSNNSSIDQFVLKIIWKISKLYFD